MTAENLIADVIPIQCMGKRPSDTNIRKERSAEIESQIDKSEGSRLVKMNVFRCCNLKSFRSCVDGADVCFIRVQRVLCRLDCFEKDHPEFFNVRSIDFTGTPIFRVPFEQDIFPDRPFNKPVGTGADRIPVES